MIRLQLESPESMPNASFPCSRPSSFSSFSLQLSRHYCRSSSIPNRNSGNHSGFAVPIASLHHPRNKRSDDPSTSQLLRRMYRQQVQRNLPRADGRSTEMSLQCGHSRVRTFTLLWHWRHPVYLYCGILNRSSMIWRRSVESSSSLQYTAPHDSLLPCCALLQPLPSISRPLQSLHPTLALCETARPYQLNQGLTIWPDAHLSS